MDSFWQTRQRSSADKVSRARLQRRVFQHLARLHGQGRRGDDQRQQGEAQRSHAEAAASWPAPATGAPMRSRRSASESPPPNAISSAPSQISVTSGFQ